MNASDLEPALDLHGAYRRLQDDLRLVELAPDDAEFRVTATCALANFSCISVKMPAATKEQVLQAIRERIAEARRRLAALGVTPDA
jgi:tryptophanyl-tRNA synthetase